MGEFELIERFFNRPTRHAVLGIGDDCALMQPEPGMQWAISSDMLVSGRHFFADVDPVALGHKSLAVNLSDLAACGARPRAFTLALALPEANAPWLEGFAHGLLTLADAHECELIGGDTTKGPLNICITVFGEVPPGYALLRSGARPGDDLWVSGTLGDARLALHALLGEKTLDPLALETARLRLERPTPRVELGLALRGIATAAADLSDGLVGDLSHILQRSKVGATLHAHALVGCMASKAALSNADKLQYVLSGGDDYELVFTAPAARADAVRHAASTCNVQVTRVGSIEADAGLRVIDQNGHPLESCATSFDHFA